MFLADGKTPLSPLHRHSTLRGTKEATQARILGKAGIQAQNHVARANKGKKKV